MLVNKNKSIRNVYHYTSYGWRLVQNTQIIPHATLVCPTYWSDAVAVKPLLYLFGWQVPS